jgi:pilus assembly protein CpaB
MRPKSLILLSLALGCGLVAALGINQMMAKQGPSTPGGETVEIYVAMKDVNTNDQLLPEILKLEPWPKDKVPPDAVTKLDDLEGRRARTKLFAGEPVREAKLLEKGDAGIGAADTVPTGFRVVSVRVDAVKSSGNLIKPGDRVDVIVHISNQGGRGGSEPITKTFLQDVRVFAVNDVLDRDPSSGNSKVAAQTISLLVKPDQVEMVTLAEEMGKVRLSMRSPNDDEKTDTDGAVMTELLGDHTSESQRSEESEGAATAPASNPLLGLLEKMKAPVSVEPTTTVAVVDSQPELFKMTIIRGPDMEEIEIDEEGKLFASGKNHKKENSGLQLQPSAGAAGSPLTPDGKDGSNETSTLKLE